MSLTSKLLLDPWRFLTTLDWHVQNILPLEKLPIGMTNRDDLTVDDLTGRFYAIDKAGIDWINMFTMPISDAFLPFLQRLKARCAGCGVQTILGFYDMDIHSTSYDGDQEEKRTCHESSLLHDVVL
jgi:hypothetical protein